MLFWNVAVAEGRSQRELARAVRLPASRIVGLVDELEGQGYLERRTSSSDRRQRSLYLTARGRRLLDKVMTIAADHELRFSEGLKPAERSTLVRLLGRLAAAQGLGRRTHPDA
jgi:DNA-binding MarR family transcriptional regulator